MAARVAPDGDCGNSAWGGSTWRWAPTEGSTSSSSNNKGSPGCSGHGGPPTGRILDGSSGGRIVQQAAAVPRLIPHHHVPLPDLRLPATGTRGPSPCAALCVCLCVCLSVCLSLSVSVCLSLPSFRHWWVRLLVWAYILCRSPTFPPCIRCSFRNCKCMKRSSNVAKLINKQTTFGQ